MDPGAGDLVIDIAKHFVGRRGAAPADVYANVRVPLAGAPIIALVGPSGCGKTTVLRCIAGLERPDRGEIRVGGETWHDAETAADVPVQARRVGYVPQEGGLFPHLSVKKNIRFGIEHLPRRERSERVHELVDSVGLKGLEGRRPGELSGGQRQRVAVARALAIAPRLLLMDEPLSSLDPAGREQLRRDLRGMILLSRTPAVIVTHDRLEALALADRAVVMAGPTDDSPGGVIDSGPIDEVFSRRPDQSVPPPLGIETILSGRVERTREGLAEVTAGSATLTALACGSGSGGVLVRIRAADVVLTGGDDGDHGPHHESARTRLTGTIKSIADAQGDNSAMIRVVVGCGFDLTALVTRPSARELELEPGRRVGVLVKAPSVHLIPR